MSRSSYLIIVITLLMVGCSNSITKPAKPNVTSSPAGASVYANGAKLGVTPLKVNLYKAFPAGWKNLVYQATGALMIKKEGCDDFILDVNDHVLSQPIHADLKCDQPNISTVSDKSPSAGKSLVIDKPAATTEGEISIESRLKKLNNLLKQGLITNQEYQQTRQRILGEL